mgnify:CR=1 FL=1
MKPVKVNKSFADLRDPELYLNLQVIANDDSSTLVHSLYLCALSDKIFSMFLQCEDKKIFLNMSPNVLRSVIQLGNYGFCDISDDNIVPLMKAGKEFEIVYLSNLCGEELWRKISHSTAVDSLKLARQFLCSHIVERIEIFIRRNFSDFILEEPLQVKNIVLFYIRFRIISSWPYTTHYCLVPFYKSNSSYKIIIWIKSRLIFRFICEHCRLCVQV